MAVYSWIAESADPSLHQAFGPCLEQLGLELLPEFCSERQLYAEDPSHARLPLAARVKVLVSRTVSGNGEWQVEVRSAEPMVRRATRCQHVAGQLRSLMPAQA